MNAEEIVTNIRETYAARFKTWIEGCPPKTMVEGTWRDPDGKPALAGQLQLPWRGDLFIPKADGEYEAVMVTVDSASGFDRLELTRGPLEVSLAPFHWNECLLTIVHERSRDTTNAAIKKWFLAWIKPGDELILDGKNGALREAVHFVSDPQVEAGQTLQELDFGTAPAAAFWALMDALRDAGVTRVSIGQ